MARTIQEIKNEMTAAWIASPAVIERYQIQEGDTFEQRFSPVSIENIYFYICAFAAWINEKLFDTHKAEILDIIAKMKPHSVAWYGTKAKEYQHGFNLPEGFIAYDNTNISEDAVEQSKVVKYAAIKESDNLLRFKLAKIGTNGDLEQLSQGERDGFTAYMNRIKDAGVRIETISYDAAKLKLRLKIYYNAMIMNSQGEYIAPENYDNATEPVKTAVKKYLANIEFDGVLNTVHLTDALQRVEGVKMPLIVEIAHKYGNLPYVPVDVTNEAAFAPEPGYIVVDDDVWEVVYGAY